ncbi:PKD domain-containing protein [Fulvivirga sedimenti]|uniref:PKD domain-containing protein n=1 Tax=Fulvivirga sedimenti TaxID=2879465 RepID=A0A9X1HUA6_9BACT|nr:PKD domain-containing protein [Fulvivirga sedimenti]MCA6074657.1 hypothetical protein [Fulvivirga sedimenti]MCA6075834.1 hypothetical protein [Fulvivirga sedimenti]MCA6076962.1 hypothetical protein [Fulvivirga sedimenti]
MKSLLKNITLLAFLILATNFFGCSEDDEDNLPKVIAGFTQKINQESGTVTFFNTSENADQYLWDFGNDETSTEINPIRTFSNGTYTVTLTAINFAGASDTFEDTFTIAVPETAALPITFDNSGVNYDPTVFGGTSFEVVSNPDQSGSNDKETNVGAITNNGEEFEGLFFDLGRSIDLTTDKRISMNFWSEAPISVLMKLEEGTAAAIETTANHGGSGWEKISFDFTSIAEYNRLTIFVDGPGTTAGTFYIDDIIQESASSGGPVLPTSPAPTPSQPESDVISVYSDAYTDVPVEGFNFYGAAAFEEVDIAGNKALKYTFVEGDGGNFQVIELGGANQIDAAAAGMTNFRFDIWFPNEVDETSAMLMKLVNFGTSTSEGLINVNPSSSPAIAQGSWLSFDIPFSELESNGLTESSNIQQIVVDLLTSGEVYIDNIYFYKTAGSGGPIPPTSPAPTPTDAPENVISIYSDAYTDVAREGFNFYGNAAFEEVSISGNGALKYTFVETDGGNFQVMELGGANQIDAAGAGMTNFRFDLWFPNELDENSAFLMKLVDFGATTSEALININASSSPAIAQGTWLQFDLPFTELESNGLAGSSNIQQVVVDLINSGEVYIDNIYFYKPAGSSGPVPPTSPAPTPTQSAANVISIYSDAYTDVAREGFNFYGNATFEEVSISGNGALKYTFAEVDGGNFQVIELGGANQIDAAAAGMTNFRFDLWFPNDVDANSAFLMKLVDFGAVTSEALINVNASSSPAIKKGQWLQFDIPFSVLQSNGLAASSNIQQLVIDLVNSGEVYIDNIFFYKEESMPSGSIINLTFDDAASITNWMRLADANSDEASIEWVADGGVQGGAMRLSGLNPTDAAGKAYIFQLDLTDLNYDGASNVRLTFDMKLGAPLVAAVVHLQTNIPGVGVTNNYEIHAQGLNESIYTSLTFDFSGVDAAGSTMMIHFNIASGAVVGAGGVVLVDNIKLVKN